MESSKVLLPDVPKISLNDIAELLDEKAGSVVKFCMTDLGMLVAANVEVDRSTACTIVEGFGKLPVSSLDDGYDDDEEEGDYDDDDLESSLETGYGLNAQNIAVRLDGDGPTLLAPLDLEGQAAALDLTYDSRTRRVAGLVTLGERQVSLRVSGVVVELREVAVLTRNLNRGEPVREGDVALERRPRESVAPDAQGSATTILGEVAQNTLTAGTVLRVTDTAPPDLVARGENVTIVYETPSISLSMRGLSNDSGRMGAVVNVVNVASKKVLQATVIGPGRVSVSPSPAARLPRPPAARLPVHSHAARARFPCPMPGPSVVHGPNRSGPACDRHPHRAHRLLRFGVGALKLRVSVAAPA